MGRILYLGITEGLAISRSFQLVLKKLLSAWAQLSHLFVREIVEKADQCQMSALYIKFSKPKSCRTVLENE